MWERLKGESKEEKELRAVLKQAEKLYNDAIAHASEREKKSIENSLTKDGDIAYSKKGKDNTLTIQTVIAPYYDTELTKENYNEIKQAVDEDFKSRADTVADAIGVKIVNVSENVGGFEFSEGDNAGKFVNELSYSFELANATTEQADLFASIMGDLGWERQEAVISSNYLPSDSTEADAFELEIFVKSIDGLEETLQEVGIRDYTIDRTNKIIKLLNFNVSEQNVELENKVHKLIEALGNNYVKDQYSKIASRYLDREARRMAYKSWLTTFTESRKDGEFHIHSSEGLTRARNNEEERSRAQSERNGEQLRAVIEHIFAYCIYPLAL